METNASTPVEGWSSHTLFAYITTVIVETDRRYEQRFIAQERAIAVATGTITGLLEERDRRYEERFNAQQEALSVALAVVNKEFHEHIIQVRDETTAALVAADKAIVKSELANEKRFENVNEFRGQLADQAATFIPRKEAEQRIDNVAEKLAEAESRLSVTLTSIGSRLDLSAGRADGSNVEARLAAIAKQIEANSASIIAEGAKAVGGQEAVAERRQSNAALYATVGACTGLILFFITIAGFLAGR